MNKKSKKAPARVVRRVVSREISKPREILCVVAMG